MTVTINGKTQEVESGLTVAQLLKSLGFQEGQILVERNGVALFPRELTDTFVDNGDRLELIQIAAGG